MTRLIPLCFLLLAQGFAGAALAQGADEAEPPPLYDVEIVIFKNRQVPKSREFALPVSSPGKDEDAIDLASPTSLARAEAQGYRLLPTAELRLVDQVERLLESPRYDLLAHIGWRQPGLAREAALPLWIRGGRIFGPEYTSIDDRIPLLEARQRGTTGEPAEGKSSFEFDEQTLEALELQQLQDASATSSTAHGGIYELEGKITIALARYLHAYVDLVLRRPRLSRDIPPTAEGQVEVEVESEIEESPLDDVADARILNNHALREHRRMRSRNLHYLDNPEFSLLILITPYELPQGVETIPTEAPATETSDPAATDG